MNINVPRRSWRSVARRAATLTGFFLFFGLTFSGIAWYQGEGNALRAEVPQAAARDDRGMAAGVGAG